MANTFLHHTGSGVTKHHAEMRAIRARARADLADRLTCLVIALIAVGLVIVPIAHLLSGLFAHLAAVLPR